MGGEGGIPKRGPGRIQGLSGGRSGVWSGGTPQSKSKQAKNETQETPEETKTHTLPELVKELGEATEEEVAHYIEGKTDAELIEEGADVGTTRIDTDAARLYGLASDFFKKATPEQRGAVMGVSPAYLRVGAWAALQGSLQYEALGNCRLLETALATHVSKALLPPKGRTAIR